MVVVVGNEKSNSQVIHITTIRVKKIPPHKSKNSRSKKNDKCEFSFKLLLF